MRYLFTFQDYKKSRDRFKITRANKYLNRYRRFKNI